MASVQASLQQGRINRAFEEARRLSDIGEGRPDKRELLTILDTICTAGSAVKANDYEQARRKILALQHLLSGAKWLKQVGEQLKQIDELSTQLHGGPLGLVPQYEMGAPRHALLSPGRVLLPDLVPGPVKLQVAAAGHNTETRTVTVVKDVPWMVHAGSVRLT